MSPERGECGTLGLRARASFSAGAPIRVPQVNRRPSSAPGPAPAEFDRARFIQALSQRLRRPLEQFFERRIGPGPECEDLVQEVFERLLRQPNLDTLERL